MSVKSVLVANRGEIAVRVIQAARSLQIRSVAVHAHDDAGARHVQLADASHELPASGSAAYLDVAAIVAAALETGCDSVHPGYGFLSESAALASACQDAGLVFVGPDPDVLAIFGDKTSARAAALRVGLPVLRASAPGLAADEARAFLESLGVPGSVMVKAVAGGGGRGIRPVHDVRHLDDAMTECSTEAARAFGDGTVYLEEMMGAARHVEVQLLGDGTDVVDLGDRDCSLQRRRQKIVEIAPAPGLPDDLRERVRSAAVELGRAVGLSGVATVETLVDVARDRFCFLEVNPRIQVEHTVTEEVTGFDLVAAQLRIAGGERLVDLPRVRRPVGAAVQLRLNAETIDPDGSVRPSAGTLTTLELPTGRGVRVDTAATVGAVVTARYDSLLAKIVLHEREDGDLADLLGRAADALHMLRVEGPATNVDLLHAVLQHPVVLAGEADTTFVDTHLAELLAAAPRRPEEASAAPVPSGGALMRHGGETDVRIEPGADVLRSPWPGVVVTVDAVEGGLLAPDAPGVVVEAMKMEHVVRPGRRIRVLTVLVAPGDTVEEGQPLAVVEALDHDGDEGVTASVVQDLDAVRPELVALEERRAWTLDENRPAAVAKQHAKGHRTARENVADLVDEGSFAEYGSLVVAAQRSRRPLSDLVERTPADGLVCGTATIDGARCVVMAYDYTVLAGTQGALNHRKQARLLDLAQRERLPVVVFAEGGGGRPGDTDGGFTTGLAEHTFERFAALSGVVPLVTVVNGRCFAGNAALAGCSDVIIATRGSSLGMSGPAMIEGGGLGVVAADDVGPMDVQTANGVVDVLVEDEAEATDIARRYLGYLTRPNREGEHEDQRMLRHVVPESRTRAYDVRDVVAVLADIGSATELRAAYGVGIRTWLARIDGRAVGVLANNPAHLGGAIDSPAADKAARFLQLCDAHALPVVVLCDTPGFMVGPEAERTGTVRRFSRLFVTGAKLRVPLCMVVLRKAYGLGAMAMAGGSLHTPVATLAWPTGELGPMGLEGAVRLGFRAELETIEDPEARRERQDALVAEAYENGKATSVASIFEVDEVIDPVDTRARISSALQAANPLREPRRGFIDTW